MAVFHEKFKQRVVLRHGLHRSRSVGTPKDRCDVRSERLVDESLRGTRVTQKLRRVRIHHGFRSSSVRRSGPTAMSVSRGRRRERSRVFYGKRLDLGCCHCRCTKWIYYGCMEGVGIQRNVKKQQTRPLWMCVGVCGCVWVCVGVCLVLSGRVSWCRSLCVLVCLCFVLQKRWNFGQFGSDARIQSNLHASPRSSACFPSLYVVAIPAPLTQTDAQTDRQTDRDSVALSRAVQKWEQD